MFTRGAEVKTQGQRDISLQSRRELSVWRGRGALLLRRAARAAAAVERHAEGEEADSEEVTGAQFRGGGGISWAWRARARGILPRQV